MSSIIKFDLKELKRLSADKQSCIEERKVTQNLPLQPWCLGNIKESIKNLLDYKIGKYNKEYNGILLSYKNLKVLQNFGAIRNDNADIHFEVQADYFIFRPFIGARLNGFVNKKSFTHLGLLVHKVFNVVILRPTEEPGDGWIGSQVEEGQEVTFKIVMLDLFGALPYIRGEIDERSLINKLDPLLLKDQIDSSIVQLDNVQPYRKNKFNEKQSIKLKGKTISKLGAFQGINTTKEKKSSRSVRANIESSKSPKDDNKDNIHQKNNEQVPHGIQSQIDDNINYLQNRNGPKSKNRNSIEVHNAHQISKPSKVVSDILVDMNRNLDNENEEHYTNPIKNKKKKKSKKLSSEEVYEPSKKITRNVSLDMGDHKTVYASREDETYQDASGDVPGKSLNDMKKSKGQKKNAQVPKSPSPNYKHYKHLELHQISNLGKKFDESTEEVCVNDNTKSNVMPQILNVDDVKKSIPMKLAHKYLPKTVPVKKRTYN